MRPATVDAIFHALSDATRRLILDELAQRDEQTRYEIAARLVMKHGVSMTLQGIGKHVAVLRKAGLVRVERLGKFKVLSLDKRPVREVSEGWIEPFVGEKAAG